MAGIDVSSLFSVSGKVALVTGGSRGIGRMMADGLIQAGATVYVSSRKQDACDRTAAELCAHGPCHSLPADVAIEEGRAALVEAIAAREPCLHILVNNAGAAWGAPYAEYPAAAFDKVLRLNVAAPFLLTRDLTPLLERGAADGDPARVINVGSMDGLQVQQRVGTGTFAYSASKAA
ncbi:MAG: SDR family NAD(P)-dependent oxidoreductase, partial [Acidobacteria bacterium]|nr:SDR family NAD(P)-dependent oxidoreductase [Acidobacteriota bacterium]